MLQATPNQHEALNCQLQLTYPIQQCGVVKAVLQRLVRVWHCQPVLVLAGDLKRTHRGRRERICSVFCGPGLELALESCSFAVELWPKNSRCDVLQCGVVVDDKDRVLGQRQLAQEQTRELNKSST